MIEETIRYYIAGYATQFGIHEIPDSFYESIKHTKYGVLIFLENVQNVEPFEIHKTGFGTQAAWFILPDIDSLRINTGYFF